MEDYEPLDLSAFCNAGVELIAEGQAPQTGALTFHGLPFQTGMGERCFVAFGKGIDEGPLTIPIDRPAQRVIVAHRLLRSAIKEGGPIGDPVAEYLFRLEGDETERVPIRERFEISVVPPKSFGGEGKPFLAVDDQKDSLMPRYEGPWEQAGRRQMESIPGAAQGYVLWVWENPKPDRTIEAMEVIPAGPGFLIGGITLGHRDEHPISREATREVIITLPQEEDAEKPFDLEVDVDRGIATYPYALPEQSAEEFLQDSTKGWGEPQNEKSSPAYVEIAAIPSATVKVKQGGEVLGEVPWSELESKGQLDPTERLNVRVGGQRPELGAHPRRGRRDRQAGSLSRPFPVPRGHTVRPTRLSRARQFQPGHVA